ncbi:MAG: hypothetical protein ABSA72_04320 [Nitrososphaerales archaeon]|jgi:hypothetical protein
MGKERTIYRIPVVAAASLGVLASLWYVYQNQAFDATTLLGGVVLPLAFGSAVLFVAKQRIALFAFLALFWSLIDDAPVNFDSVLTWPEVTRTHPAGPHDFMEILLHLLTIVFLCLALREALKGTSFTEEKALSISLLTAAAFVLSYAQNLPLDALRTVVENDWYQLDLAEHLASIFFLYVAVRLAMRPSGAGPTTSPGPSSFQRIIINAVRTRRIRR